MFDDDNLLDDIELFEATDEIAFGECDRTENENDNSGCLNCILLILFTVLCMGAIIHI